MATALKIADNTPKRVSDVAPSGGELTRMEDIQDRDLILLCAEQTETQYGRGYRLTLTSMDETEGFEVLTNAVVVVKQLDKALADDPFASFVVNFHKQGRCWVIV